jgi:hypothetical protein
VLVRALDRILILHADHEQNASTSTVRLAGSSGANPFACIAAGIACLWGPAHGGANEAALTMLKEIGTVDKIPEFIAQVKDKNSGVKLMGFGHRVYKNFDPRAKLMRETCYEVLNELGLQDDPLFKLAMELEKIALNDEYFVSRKLYPNVDFYSGIVQSALGIPVSLFTGIFAMARTIGWIAQWNEMIADPEQKSAVRASCSSVRPPAKSSRWTSVNPGLRGKQKTGFGPFFLCFSFYASLLCVFLLQQLVEDSHAVVVDADKLHPGLVAELHVGVAVDHLAHGKHLVVGVAQPHLERDRAVLRQPDLAVRLQADAAMRQVQRVDRMASFIGHGQRGRMADRMAMVGSRFLRHGALPKIVTLGKCYHNNAGLTTMGAL